MRAGASPAPTGSERTIPGPEGLSPNSLAFQGRTGDTEAGTNKSNRQEGAASSAPYKSGDNPRHARFRKPPLYHK